MATPIIPSEPSTVDSTSNPNSITSLMKTVEEQKKQAASDTKYDTKGKLYDGFTDMPSRQKIISIGLSFTIAAGILLVVGALLPKSRKR
jgi:hypothetical protein